ncbi:hypothetical protein [Nitrospina gracilis]|uniref:hypothetical protein n=1 Tax=Nitrospina gracilis TaxID=35801 RepID=UPI001F1C97F3|nr:hypothetical protein [Nitrospina gracilis]MCF8720484.1 hypothetical protein [Nitrospina gracilis Nb-211]
MTALWMGIALLGFVTGTFAQGAPPSPVTATTRIEPHSATIGDTVTYTVAVTHAPNFKINPPSPFPHFEKFEFLDQGEKTKQLPDGNVTDEFIFQFRAMEVGYYNIPEVPVHFTAPHPDDPSRSIPGEIQAPKAVVEVRSVLFKDGDPKDIRDIKPIVGAAPPWRRYALYALAGLVGLMFLYFIGRKFFAKPPHRERKPTPVVREPHEVALEELDALAAKQLIEQERCREHHFELSEIFRRYLGALYSVPALDWTTEEIMQNLLMRKNFPEELGQRALEILHRTDWVKFANEESEASVCMENVQAIRRFVEDTVPRRDLSTSHKSPSAAM